MDGFGEWHEIANNRMTIMKEQIKEYALSLYRDIPATVYEGLLSVFCLGVVIIIAFWGFRNGWRKIAGLVLAEFVFLIYCSTVIFRTAADGNGHEFKPFWSYEAIENGRSELIAENVMNVVVFIPIGALLGFMVNGARCTVMKELLIVLIVAMGISLSIEAMQYFFHRGFAETDDVMHNTIGCIVGYMLVLSVARLYKSGIAERRVHGSRGSISD